MRKQITLFALFLSLFFANIASAADATLFLTPITGTYIAGDTFTVSVAVDSGGAPVNAIEGRLEYDPKELTVLSVSKTNSVLSSWVSEPAFDNELGTLSFGGSLATATALTRETVLKFEVRGQRSGEFRIRFVSGAAIHAADGTGGNIVSALNNGVYKIIPLINDPSTAVVQEGEILSAGGEVLGAATGTTITSPTHPDQTLWYALATSTLNWDLPSGLSGIRLSLDKKENGVGNISYPTTLHQKIIGNIRDGVYYFHVTRDALGGESETTNYKLQIDSTVPTGVTVTEVERTDPTNPHVAVMVSATDTMSGIDHYEFTIDGGSPTNWTDAGGHTYTLPASAAGTHQLIAMAVDKAGNKASSSLDFIVKSLPTPVITVVNPKLSEESKLKLSVVTVPNATLVIAVQKGDSSPVTEEYNVDAAGRGEFESALALVPGTYIISATAHNALGALSSESEKQTIEVSASTMGVIKRHPLIPVAAIALVVLIALAWWFLFMRGRDEEVIDEGVDDRDDGNNYAEEPDSRDTYIEQAPVSRNQFSGTVVLEKKKKIEMPATRL